MKYWVSWKEFIAENNTLGKIKEFRKYKRSSSWVWRKNKCKSKTTRKHKEKRFRKSVKDEVEFKCRV